MPWYRLITIVTGLGIAVLLRLLLYRSRLGVSMRAVVDNRDLAALNGARPGRTSQFAWALGTSMSAIAGIFLAEELSNLSVETLTLFIVDAFAAAIIGRLKSLPLTYVGGIIIGLSIAFQQNFLTWSGRWSSASFAIPTMILFLALLFLPQARIEGRRITSTVTPRVPSMRRAAGGMLVLFGFMLINAMIWERIGIRNLTLVMLIAFPMLSLVPLTGWSGQISLAQITFVGVGAWSFIEFSSSGGQVFGVDLFNNGSPWGLLVAAAVAVPFGLLMALARAPAPGSVPGAGHDGVRAHGRVRDLRPTRGLRERRSTASRRSRSSGSGSTSRSRCSASTSPPTPRTSSSSPRCSASSASAWSRSGAGGSAAAWWPCATARPRARPSA